MRGTREAKRKRQYRARHRKRERLLRERWYAHQKTKYVAAAFNPYGISLLDTLPMRYLSWTTARTMRKWMASEWDWFKPLPGAAQGVTLDNPQGLAPVIPLRADPP